jgi:hypothetical protein
VQRCYGGRGWRWADPVQAGGIWRTSWRACGGATAGEVGDGADPARVAGGAGAFFLMRGAVPCGARTPSRRVRTALCIRAHLFFSLSADGTKEIKEPLVFLLQ